MPAELAIILVNYNTRDMTLRCLATLMPELAGIDAEVWLVDNASTDNSVDAIRQQFPAVHLIANTDNLGFGRANNQAMVRSTAGNFLLLNTDAFVHPGSVRALLDHLAAHPSVGVVGPRLLNTDGSLQVSCYPYPSPARAWFENLWLARFFPNSPTLGDYQHWPHDAPRSVQWLIGACILVRREAYEQTGGFDEQFFMYVEETDWQKRIRQAGWEIAFTPAAVVTHAGGASSATDKPRINRHVFESLDYYQLKHGGWGALILFRAAMAVGCSLRAVLWLGAFLLRPAQRELASAKVRLHSWLVFRQLTHWFPLHKA